MAKKWWNLKNEEEKNMSYSNIPGSNVDSIMRKRNKYSDKENNLKIGQD
jgi:hypothetical protein